MGALKQWAFAVCAAMVACGLAGMLLPKSGLEKMFRMVVSIFFLCCLLSPIVLSAPALLEGIEWELDLEAQRRAEQLSEAAEQQTRRVIEQNLRKLVEDNLADSGINVRGVTINMVTNGQSEAEVESVLVRLDAEQEPEHDELVRRLEELLGLDVELEFVQA